MSFGNEVFKEPEASRFYKKVNYQSIYSNADISEYNVQSYIHKLEELEEYEYPFERLRHVLGDQFDKESKKEELKKEDVKTATEEEPMIEEVTDEKAAEIEKKEE